MLEFVVLATGTLLGLALIAGGALLLVKLARQGRGAEMRKIQPQNPSFAAANDFEVDYRRVLTFARLTVRR